MGNKSSGGSAPAPDPNIGIAQKQMADLATQEFNQWQTDVWPALKAQTESQTTNANNQAAIDLQTQTKQNAIADEQYQMYKNTYQPLQQQLVDQAENYNTPANEERLAQGAIGDVNTAFNNQKQAQTQQMQSYGINPTSGQFQGMQNSNQVLQAAQSSAAATQARNAAEQLGWAKKMDAAGMASGQYGNQATATQLGLSAGGQSLAAGQIPISNSAALSSSMAGGYGGAMQGWQNVGNLGVQSYQTQVQAYNAQQAANAQSSAGIGSALGAAVGGFASGGTGSMAGKLVGLMSDIRAKENIELVGHLPNGLGIYEFEYRPEFKDHKFAGHGKFRGLMAHEVEKVIPEAVFTMDNGYKVIDYSKVN